MGFVVNQREQDGAVIFAPDGRLDTVTSKEFETLLFERIDGGASRVLIDFGSVDYISSYGLRVVIKAAKRLSGGFGVFGLGETIEKVFVVSGFSKVVAISPTLEDALAKT